MMTGGHPYDLGNHHMTKRWANTWGTYEILGKSGKIQGETIHYDHTANALHFAEQFSQTGPSRASSCLARKPSLLVNPHLSTLPFSNLGLSKNSLPTGG